jgi:hypothetical protein
MLIADVVFFAVALALSLFVRVHRVGGGCAQVRGSSGALAPQDRNRSSAGPVTALIFQSSIPPTA